MVFLSCCDILPGRDMFFCLWVVSKAGSLTYSCANLGSSPSSACSGPEYWKTLPSKMTLGQKPWNRRSLTLMELKASELLKGLELDLNRKIHRICYSNFGVIKYLNSLASWLSPNHSALSSSGGVGKGGRSTFSPQHPP